MLTLAVAVDTWTGNNGARRFRVQTTNLTRWRHPDRETEHTMQAVGGRTLENDGFPVSWLKTIINDTTFDLLVTTLILKDTRPVDVG